MCGITGFWEAAGDQNAEALCRTVQRMALTLILRGPDDSGEWVDVQAGIALGFRRLSIIDLSPAGHQPMASASGRFMIAYNGEVYNAEALRKELEAQGAAPAFRGHSDTEVMLAAFEAWGLEAAVRKFIGMFAFALWDRQERTLHLVRDRLGVKPLYYGHAGRALVFGSELKSLRAHPHFQGEINRDALALMMRLGYIPAPHSIYKKVWKLPPGSILTIRTGEVSNLRPVTYWSAREAAETGLAHPFTGSELEAADRLDAMLRDAVGLRMIADVPLGVFLSGGIDSSLVVAQMQAQSPRPVKTFTIGFHEDSHNEAKHALAVAKHLGTEHTEMYVSPDMALGVIPKLPQLYDEPFADPSQIPTYLVSELARRSVTVSLSGDGGDELFTGYNRYFWGQAIWKRFGRMPPALRSLSATALAQMSPMRLSALLQATPAGIKKRHPGDRLQKLAEMVNVGSQEAMYAQLVSHWKNPEQLVLGAKEPLTPFTDAEQWQNLPEFMQRMAYMDTAAYLPDDILVKVDRASMGVSLEAREPLLDHRLVEFAWQIPSHMKVREGKGKWLLRQVLYRYVPQELIERPKAGFAVPIADWLRGPLREWAENLLDARRLQAEGFLNPTIIQKKWAEHLSCQYNWQYYLWCVLMFQAWMAEQNAATLPPLDNSFLP